MVFTHNYLGHSKVTDPRPSLVRHHLLSVHASLDNVSLVPSAFMQCDTWCNTSQMSARLPRCSLSVFPFFSLTLICHLGHHHSLKDCRLLWRNAQSFEMCYHKPSLKHIILVSDGEGEAEEGEGKRTRISFCGSVVLGCSPPWYKSRSIKVIKNCITFIINISTNGGNRLHCHNLPRQTGRICVFVWSHY